MAQQLMHAVDQKVILDKFYTTPPAHYIAIFNPQVGRGLPHFRGTHYQRGSGLIGDAIRHFAFPLIRAATPHVLKGIARVASDVSRGRKLKESAKKRGTKVLEGTAKTLLKGKGAKTRKRKESSSSKPPKKMKKDAITQTTEELFTAPNFSLFNGM